MIKRSVIASALILATASCGAALDTPKECDTRAEPFNDRHIGVARAALAGGSDDLLPPSLDTVSDLAASVAGYYSQAKTAIEVATKLAEVLGILKAADPNAQFIMLKDTIQQTGRAIDWKNTMLFIDSLRGPALFAVDRLQRTNPIVEGSNEDQSSASSANSISGESAFFRPFNDAATDGLWRIAIKDRAKPNAQGLVYDWRLGVPAMLELVADRLHVIASMDPNFRSNSRYDVEMRRYRDAMQGHYDKMQSGVKCALNLPGASTISLGYFCADIFTGAFTTFGGRFLFPDSTESEDHIYARIASDLKRAMPLFAMKRLIDTLDLYIGGGQDLTQGIGDIRPARSSDLCLDGQDGDSSPERAMQMRSCDIGNSQWWLYDRPSGEIRNPAFGTCLDVKWGDATPTTAWTYWCNGLAAQRWTYNPVSQVLQSEIGTVLQADTILPPTPPILNGSVRTAVQGFGLAGQFWAESPVCSSICTAQGGPLPLSCDPSCTQSICDVDPFCCESSWDDTCVSEVQSVCHLKC